MTRTASGGKTSVSETISIDGARYVMVGGKWSKSPQTLADAKVQEEANKKNAKVIACRHVGDDSVNGEAVEVYTEHAETEDTKADTKIWISKSKGLILKQELALDPSGERWTIQFEYANVHAPM
jgi:hypothetical protein